MVNNRPEFFIRRGEILGHPKAERSARKRRVMTGIVCLLAGRLARGRMLLSDVQMIAAVIQSNECGPKTIDLHGRSGARA